MRILLVEDDAKTAAYVARGLRETGQSVELSFETLPRPDGQFRNFFLDDIQFSTSPAVPEPSTVALASMTIAAFLLIAKRRSTK